MKKTAHQIYREAKEKGLDEEEFKSLLKKEGVIVPKENFDRQYQIASNILKRIQK